MLPQPGIHKHEAAPVLVAIVYRSVRASARTVADRCEPQFLATRRQLSARSCRHPCTPQAFAGYLGEGWEQGAAEQYDATELAKRYDGPQLPVLMDTGTDDEFLKVQVRLGGRGGCRLVAAWAQPRPGGQHPCNLRKCCL